MQGWIEYLHAPNGCDQIRRQQKGTHNAEGACAVRVAETILWFPGVCRAVLKNRPEDFGKA